MESVKNEICHNCGEILIARANYCSKCGAKVQGEKVCASCGTVLTMDALFCHMCGEKNIDSSENKNISVIQSNGITALSHTEKLIQLLNKLENFNCTILKDVGNGFYFVLTRETYDKTYKILRLYDFRDISNINLNTEEFECGLINDLLAYEVFSTRNDVWMGTVNNGYIYCIIKEHDDWVLHRVDVAELDKCGSEKYKIEKLKFEQNFHKEKPMVVKCADGSQRIIYGFGCCEQQQVVLDMEGKVYFDTANQNIYLSYYLHNQYFMIDPKRNSEYRGTGIFDIGTGKEIVPCIYDRIFVYKGKTSDKILFIPIKDGANYEGAYEHQDVFCLIENNKTYILNREEMLEVEPLITKIDWDGRISGKFQKDFGFERVEPCKKDISEELKFYSPENL